MAKASQLVVEVCYVLLPATEMDERRERLRALLVRGAYRLIQQPPPEKVSKTELVTAGPAQE